MLFETLFGTPNLEEKIRRFIKQKIDVKYRDLFDKTLRPAIGVRVLGSERSIEYRGSKYGGLPEIPPGFEWPRYEGKPMSFVAQYKLSEFARFDKESLLQSHGMLYIFIYVDKSFPAFYFSDDRKSYKIMYVPNEEGLTRADKPDDLPEDEVFAPKYLSFYQKYTIPDDESYKLWDNLTQEDWDGDFNEEYEKLDEYIALVCGENKLGFPEDKLDQILGEDSAIQQCANFSFALSQFSYKNNEEWELIKPQVLDLQRKYTLLLQLDFGNKDADFSNYGGSGCLYVGIEPNHLELLDFDKAIMVCQGT